VVPLTPPATGTTACLNVPSIRHPCAGPFQGPARFFTRCEGCVATLTGPSPAAAEIGKARGRARIETMPTARARAHGGAVVWLGWALAAACGDPESLPCEEPAGVAPELDRVALMVGEVSVSAEVAQGEEARSSAWAGRQCDLDALLWVPEAVGPAAVELCAVVVAVDLAFVHQGEVVAVEPERPPCERPCEACPVYGDDGPAVDAVLWLPAGQVDVGVGDSVTGLEVVDLPTG